MPDFRNPMNEHCCSKMPRCLLESTCKYYSQQSPSKWLREILENGQFRAQRYPSTLQTVADLSWMHLWPDNPERIALRFFENGGGTIGPWRGNERNTMANVIHVVTALFSWTHSLLNPRQHDNMKSCMKGPKSQHDFLEKSTWQWKLLKI